MDVADLFGHIPFANHLGIEVTEAVDGTAAGYVEFQDEHSSNPAGRIAHGGVTYSLADTVGGAAVVSVNEDVTPTVDMRMDYLAPATTDLYAEAELVRNGGSVAVAAIEVYALEGAPEAAAEGSVDTARADHVATARGVYKTGGDTSETPWNTSG